MVIPRALNILVDEFCRHPCLHCQTCLLTAEAHISQEGISLWLLYNAFAMFYFELQSLGSFP